MNTRPCYKGAGRVTRYEVYTRTHTTHAHCTLYTVHYTVHTVTVHCTLYTAHFSLYTSTYTHDTYTEKRQVLWIRYDSAPACTG